MAEYPLVVRKANLPNGTPFLDAPRRKKKKSSNVTTLEMTNKFKSVRSPVQSFHFSSYSSEGWVESEYDLAEPYRIADLESLFRQAIKKKVALAFKHGYEFTSYDKRALQYIRARHAQIARVSKIPTTLLVRRIFRDLTTCHNAFLIKVRDEKASGGKTRVNADGKKLKPVAAYFPVHPSTMQLYIDKNKITKWRHALPSGESKEFFTEDVIHFHIDRKEGFFFGTPLTVPVVDDIRALRKIEENVEMMLYQFLFPLFHYQIGTEDSPAGADEEGNDEIDVIRSKLQYMAAEGGIVTPHRHKIELLGVQGRSVRAETYLTYFRERVLGGLGISSVDVGISDTTNRNTSDSMSRSLVDAVKDIQLVVSEMWDLEITQELLLESTFSDNLDFLEDPKIVNLRWHEIDTDYLVKVQNHLMDMFLKNGITHSELRRALQKDPIKLEEGDEDYEELAFNVFDKTLALIKASDEPWSPAAKAAAKQEGTGFNEEDLEASKAEQLKRDKELKKTAAAATAKNKAAAPKKKTNISAKVKPSNQHGSGVPTRKKDSLEFWDKRTEEEKEEEKTKIKIVRGPRKITWERYKESGRHFLSEEYKLAEVEVTDFVKTLSKDKIRQQDLDHIKMLLKVSEERLIKTLKAEMYNCYHVGRDEEIVGKKTKLIPLHAIDYINNRAEKYVERAMKKLNSSIQRALIDKNVSDGKISPELAVKDRFEALEFRMRFMAHVEPWKAYSYGKTSAWMEKQGFKLPPIVATSKGMELKFQKSARDLAKHPKPKGQAGPGGVEILKKQEFPLLTIESQDGACELCSANSESLAIAGVTEILLQPEQMPPFHPACQCKASLEVVQVQIDEETEETKTQDSIQDGAKLDRCVASVKSDLKKKHPTWSDKKVESAAFAICKAKVE